MLIKNGVVKRGMQKEAVLEGIATRLRIHVLKMTSEARSGHPTTCLSMAELMACLFFEELRFNVRDPFDLNNDEFVLSKGHASPILWASFAEAGLIPLHELEKYRQMDSVLEGHPTPRLPWVKSATGSLGQGLGIGLGLALAAKLQKSQSRVFVMLGDGECAEGSVWESAALAAKCEASNLVAVLDCNRLGQSGESLHGKECSRWKEKFESFGWHAVVIDGHKVHQIVDALAECHNAGLPSIIIAKTVKGKGVSFLEDKEGWHGKVLKADELARALDEIGPMPAVVSAALVQSRKSLPMQKKSLKKQNVSGYEIEQLVATREAYGAMLAKLGVNERVVALDADVKNSTFSEKFKARFPQRFVDCFIAEQNMVEMAVGFAARGFVPFVSTFAAFLSRAHDQIRMAGISRANVKFCGSHVGVSIGEDGPSQMGLEDIALFRTIPESVVLYPCDAVSAEKCTALLGGMNGIGYLRTSRPKTPVVYKKSESFKIGGSKIVRKDQGAKTVIIAAGVTVHEALKAADLLATKKKKVIIIDAYSIKPLDEKTIRNVCKGKKVIVVEDHYPQGGLGEAVAALGIPIAHLAVKEIPRSGKPEELLHKYKIDAQAIVDAVKKA